MPKKGVRNDKVVDEKRIDELVDNMLAKTGEKKKKKKKVLGVQGVTKKSEVQKRMCTVAGVPAELFSGRPLKIKDEKEFMGYLQAYFQYCTDYVKPLTISGLAFFLGMDRRAILNYSHREPFYNIIKKVKSLIEMGIEQELLIRKTTPIGLFFYLKNNFGWTDKTEVEHKITGFSDFVDKIGNIKPPSNLPPPPAPPEPVVEGEIVENPPNTVD